MEVYNMAWEKMVHDNRGRYVKLKIGDDNKIYLGGSYLGFKVGNDQKIYTDGGSLVTNDSVEKFLKDFCTIK